MEQIKKLISIRIDEEELKYIEKLAAEQERNTSNMIRVIIKNFVKCITKKKKGEEK